MRYFCMYRILIICLVILGCIHEKQTHETRNDSQKKEFQKGVLHKTGNTIATRFTPPEGYSRSKENDNSFDTYLRNLLLLPPHEKVKLYNGSLKSNQSIHEAVVDISVGDKDLQQCADAVIRLRAEYLFSHKKYNDIAFHFTNGWLCEYSKWMDGNDLVIQGNRTSWKPSFAKPGYDQFLKYLEMVFMYAGTLSLQKELSKKTIENIQIGDVFIKGGSPGHAVIVVDMAKNVTTGDKAFLLAQSYMPAQQIHILKNLKSPAHSPWYLISEIQQQLSTPEWTFETTDLHTF